jgi:hypothetical protein
VHGIPRDGSSDGSNKQITNCEVLGYIYTGSNFGAEMLRAFTPVIWSAIIVLPVVAISIALRSYGLQMLPLYVGSAICFVCLLFLIPRCIRALNAAYSGTSMRWFVFLVGGMLVLGFLGRTLQLISVLLRDPTLR